MSTQWRKHVPKSEQEPEEDTSLVVIDEVSIMGVTERFIGRVIDQEMLGELNDAIVQHILGGMRPVPGTSSARVVGHTGGPDIRTASDEPARPECWAGTNIPKDDHETE